MTASDHDLAGSLATAAGELLLDVRAGDFADVAARRAAGDAGSHRFLVDRLAVLCAGDAVLSEEGADDRVRLGADRVWIVDPLDGTREFSERERVDWAVHVALWERGELVAGAVALPAEARTFGTAAPLEVLARPDGPLRLAVSRSRPPALVTVLAEQLGAELVAMGSAGVKAMAVVRGQVDAYVHGGGQYEWDSAAPVAVARAAGLHTSRLDGSPLVYNQPDPWLPDLLICRSELAGQLLKALAALPADLTVPRSRGGAA
ncbi:3'(2'),5'-bisphosphate nucleotidase [Modestobacter sp. DSM 44400]|uniref:3'(2'),5'-bisphosphate nucleotidase CysQ n=1 Tax=Modestobacter sp. DSM 44400 TaxID=1550230 RepID=UPI00089BDBCC|nr:3'(2'),5'-bisphosphate nucleotidase CysQ [Modestobacter sp. DSM 44400]SDY69766.1 3'(2'),5'-bisphosphate nucleotidase [Modestobacter sp. DSM 44400]